MSQDVVRRLPFLLSILVALLSGSAFPQDGLPEKDENLCRWAKLAARGETSGQRGAGWRRVNATVAEQSLSVEGIDFLAVHLEELKPLVEKWQADGNLDWRDLTFVLRGDDAKLKTTYSIAILDLF